MLCLPPEGVGINLAIQDAVAAANMLASALREGSETGPLLAAIQQRREFPVRVIQTIQARIHKASQMRAFLHFPGLQRTLGCWLGLGVRPEHIHTPAKSAMH